MGQSKAGMETPLRRAIRFALIGLGVGVVAAVAIGLPIYLVGGGGGGTAGPLIALLVGFPLGGFVGGLFVGLVFREGVGALVERSFQGGRGHTRSEYSEIQAMIMRGAYREAVQSCEREAASTEDDPTPLMMGAEVLREHLQEYAKAARWLRRAGRIEGLSAQQDITITRELVDLYETRLDAAEKALPELARVVERYPDTRAAEWARNLTSQIRASVWTDVQPDPEASDRSTSAEQDQR